MLICQHECEVRALQFVPLMELISMFIRLEAGVKLSGGNWQQLWKLWEFECDEIKCSKSGLSHSNPAAKPNSQDLCVRMRVCFDSVATHKADICIMTAAAPALGTALQIWF